MVEADFFKLLPFAKLKSVFADGYDVITLRHIHREQAGLVDLPRCCFDKANCKVVAWAAAGKEGRRPRCDADLEAGGARGQGGPHAGGPAGARKQPRRGFLHDGPEKALQGRSDRARHPSRGPEGGPGASGPPPP